ncbi:hypothetical protein FGO68_gene13025 [Halteria grandinella]|uniref:G-patch domain-containing protein n=1 Tax=Halteria grandinella TaxID=5974 RepID=A0A8J8NJ14_HALGN|nr:hypothetical protein FGO68_gene13025 [Halteria grandinella]
MTDIVGEAKATLEKLEKRSGIIDVYLGSLGDEDYNPGQPNDYEKIMLKKNKVQREMEARIDKERIRQQQIENMKHSEGVSQINEDELEMTAEEAYQARLRRSQGNKVDSYGVAQPSVSIGDNKAKKMMEAMGWKGKGLGKQEQGIINPLIAKKTDAGSGMIQESQIVNETLMGTVIDQGMTEPDLPRPQIISLPKQKSRVLVLNNLVEPDQVDEFIRDEVKQECMKFGEVTACILHQIPGESVRVFVEYKQEKSAIAAYMDLSQRTFNVKQIEADFYSETSFEQRKFNLCSLNQI